MDDKDKIIKVIGIEYFRALESDAESIQNQLHLLIKNGTTSVNPESARKALEMKASSILKRIKLIGEYGQNAVVITYRSDGDYMTICYLGVTEELALKLLNIKMTGAHYDLDRVTTLKPGKEK